MGIKEEFSSGETLDISKDTSLEPDEDYLGDLRSRLSSDFEVHNPRLVFDYYMGCGAFGQVFKATATPPYDGTEDVAVKVMKPELLKTTDLQDLKDCKKRFARECFFQEYLSHQLPSKIVMVYDHGEFGYPGAGPEHENRFMVMELMSDKSLRHVIDAYRDYALADRISIMIKLADNFRSIHKREFVHRDFKPENALFSRGTHIVEGEKTKEFTGERRIKLTDFGLIRRIQAHTPEEEQKIIGTPHYMSPEQIEDPKSVDHRTDIFSYGVVFYELLNGVYPREVDPDQSKLDAIRQIAKAKPKPIQDINKKVNKDLNDLVMRCMAEYPGDRYQSMAEVLNEVKLYYIGAFGLADYSKRFLTKNHEGF